MKASLWKVEYEMNCLILLGGVDSLNLFDLYSALQTVFL